MQERLRINAAEYLLLKTTTGTPLAIELLKRGTRLGFGGFLSSLANATVANGTEIQIHPDMRKSSVQALAALLAHEAVHIVAQNGQSVRWPLTGENEENDAYRIEAGVWSEIGGGQHDGDWLLTWKGNFKDYMRRPGPYWSSLPLVGQYRLPWVGD